jgi:exodeoxyribonuclease V beta subunit
MQNKNPVPKTACPPDRPKTFDIAKSPLAAFTLIDASAGTGKTYTICGLILRLLLEEGLDIGEVLVVSFTEAATEDLRCRIRQTLEQALETLSGGAPPDSFLQEYCRDVTDPGRAATRLAAALRGFDEAPVFTIHGFCQRLLLENSLATRMSFDAGLLPDDTPLVREIIEDFWRREINRASPLFSRYLAAQLGPEKLL